MEGCDVVIEDGIKGGWKGIGEEDGKRMIGDKRSVRKWGLLSHFIGRKRPRQRGLSVPSLQRLKPIHCCPVVDAR